MTHSCFVAALSLLLLLFTGTIKNASAQSGPGGVSSGATNLLLWLDGQRVNADGSNPAIGSTVSTWYDRSGNGVDVTENIPNVATYSANGVTFNNTGYLNGSDATFPTGNAARTVIICASSPSTNGDDVFFFYGTGTNSQSYGILKRMSGSGTPNGVRHFFFANDQDVAGGWTPSGTLKIITASYTNNTQSLHINNDNGTPRTPGTPNTTLGAQGLQIGGWNSFDLYSQATIAEVIFYDKLLNTAERIIVNNYLAAKYGLTLSANDLYDNDNAGNGNFDYDVAGIGRASNPSQTNTDAISSIVEISGPNGLGNNEYYIWGHDNGALTPTTADVPSGIDVRLERIWRGSETGTITDFDVSVDMTGLGAVAAGDLMLLIDTDNDGSFADETAGTGGIVGGASFVSGNTYQFNNVDALDNDRRFTLASANVSTTPLPVTLLDFNATQAGTGVKLTWSTATETNNDHFTIERSRNGELFEEVGTLPGAGNAASRRKYTMIDHSPLAGRSYYRLSQTDFDGTVEQFPLISYAETGPAAPFSISPNPTAGTFSVSGPDLEDEASMLISDLQGKELYRSALPRGGNENDGGILITPSPALAPGVYLVIVHSRNSSVAGKLIVQ